MKRRRPVKRILAVLCLLIAVAPGAGFAAPRSTSPPSPPLPLPPEPPAQPPLAQLAPVPDASLQPPINEAQQGVTVSPELYSRQQRYFRGDGYLKGSTNDPLDARRAQLVPGVSVSVPLQ